MITPAMFTAAVEKAVTATEARISGDIELIDDYSGRDMEGRTCIGVAVDTVSSAITMFAMYLTLELRSMVNYQDSNEVAAALADVQFDSLGLGMVMYFPQWEYTGNESQEGLSKW